MWLFQIVRYCCIAQIGAKPHTTPAPAHPTPTPPPQPPNQPPQDYRHQLLYPGDGGALEECGVVGPF